MQEKDKHLLSRVENRISFLYIEMARIEQTQFTKCIPRVSGGNPVCKALGVSADWYSPRKRG